MSTLPLLASLIENASKQAFVTRNGKQINTDTVNNFVNYLGDVFKLGAQQGVAIDREAILKAAKSTFVAMTSDNGLVVAFDTAVAKIFDIRDSKTSEIDLSKISEEARRAPFAQHIASVLNDPTIAYSGAKELNTKDQKIFIQQA
ncbi:MAG: hypothetical protein O3C63_09520, partial [Cyanobacteria bacterium]|nr:hypothetical protein [Cyanobacteriota bacterium]